MIALILLAVVVLVALAIGLYIVNTQRSLVKMDENCKNALGQIQVQLNSRWDALLALAKTASQYAQHESETLIKVIQQRRGEDLNSAEAINSNQGELNQVLGRLIAIGEAYPDLKANEMFAKTMDGVNSYEENVRMSRMVYNDSATKLNRAVRQWPSSFVASMLHFTEREYLKVDQEQKSQMPDIFGDK
ncbi:MAG: LemA family protein [Muribaculaceae bacterium]|nr:LemA family protein [Muribaculaceae bacterium]